MTELENEVRQAFERYRKALEEALEAALERAQAKDALEARIAQGLLSGEIQGKNAEEREAKARALYADLYQALAEAEERYQRAKTALEMARAYTEEVGLLARLRVVEAFTSAWKANPPWRDKREFIKNTVF